MSAPTGPGPLELSRPDERILRIRWSDGMVRDYPARELRDRCPCATCREKRKAPEAEPDPFAVLKPEELAPVTVTQMRPAGSYAYNITFSDGHNTGLFTLELLRELGCQVGAEQRGAESE